MSPVHAWACLNRRTITRMASHSRLLSLGSCISAAVTVLSRRTTLPSSVFSCRALASSIRLIASQVSARIALIVLCSTDFFGLHAHGRRAKARNEAESSRWKANSSSLSWRYCLRSAQRSTASAGRPCRPVSCTPSRRRSAATRPSRVGCSSSHFDILFRSRPISCLANTSNRLVWTVRSWRIVGFGGDRLVWTQRPKVYLTPSAPAYAKAPIPQIVQSHSVCGRNLAYATTKGAIQNFTGGLAQLLADKGIRVNCVAPGPLWTPLIPSAMPPEKVKELGSQVPMKRPGQPRELAPVYVMLAEAEASYVSGATVAVTGGKPIL